MAQTGKHTAHTPGPWEVGYDINTPNPGLNYNRTVTRRWHNSDREVVANGVLFEANAHLIAAAPDMKAALLPLLEVVDEEIEQRKFSGNDEYWQRLQALSDAGHAAIAKAEGR